MENKVTVTTERIDDIVLLLNVMMQMGLPTLLSSTLTSSLEAARIGLGMGGNYLVGIHPVRRRPPESDGQRVGEPETLYAGTSM